MDSNLSIKKDPIARAKATEASDDVSIYIGDSLINERQLKICFPNKTI